MIQDKDTLKGYFSTGDKPTQTQFENLIDSLRHAYDKIPLEDLDLEGYDEQGTRATGITTRLGDFDGSSNGTKIVLTDSANEVKITGNLVMDGNINAAGQTVTAGSFIGDGSQLTNLPASTASRNANNNFSANQTFLGDIIIGENTNQKINFDTSTIWNYYLQSDGNNWHIDDGDGTKFIELLYNSGGNTKSIEFETLANFGSNVNIGGQVGTRPLNVFRPTDGSVATFLSYTDSLNYQGFYIDVSQATNVVTLKSSGTSGGGFDWHSGNTSRMSLSATGHLNVFRSGTFGDTLSVNTETNLLADFTSTDSIGEIRVGDNVAYTRLLNVGTDFKVMPNDGTEVVVFEGDTLNTLLKGGLNVTGTATFEGEITADLGRFQGLQIGINNSSDSNNTIQLYSTNDGVSPITNIHVGSEIILRNLSTQNGNFSALSGYNANNLVASRIAFVNQDVTNRHGRISFMTHDGVSLKERFNIGTTSIETELDIDASGQTVTAGLFEGNLSSGKGIIGNNTGNANSSYLSFLENDGTTRQGWIGMGSSTNQWVQIYSDAASKGLTLREDGTLFWGADRVAMLSDVQASDTLQEVTENGSTTTRAITTGGLTVNSPTRLRALSVDANGVSDIASFENDHGYIELGHTTNLASIDVGTNQAIRFRQGSVVPLTIESNGGVIFNDSIRVNAPNGSGSSLTLGRVDTDVFWTVNHAGGDFRLYNHEALGSDVIIGLDAASTEKNNRLGIGITPTEKLHVKGNGLFNGTLKVEDTIKVGSSAGNNSVNSGAIEFLENINYDFGQSNAYGFKFHYNGDGNQFNFQSGNSSGTSTIFSVGRDGGDFTFSRGLALNDGFQNRTSHWYERSIYHATNGILIETDAVVGSDKMIELIIEGNSYFNHHGTGPITSRVQAYNYVAAGTIINAAALSNDADFTIDVFHYNGKVYFWFEQTSAFQTYSFKTNAGVGSSPVKIVNVTNAVKPTTGVTNNVSITPIKMLTSMNFAGIVDDNFVTLHSTQTITGGKTFTGAIQTQGLNSGGAIIVESVNPTIALKETDTTDQNIDIQVNSGQLKIFGVNDVRDTFNEWVTLNASNGLLDAKGGFTSASISSQGSNNGIWIYDRVNTGNSFRWVSAADDLKLTARTGSPFSERDVYSIKNSTAETTFNYKLSANSGLDVTGTTQLKGNTIIHTGNSESGALTLQRHTYSTTGDDIARLWVDDAGLNLLLDNDNDGDTGVFSFYKKVKGSNNLMFRVGTSQVEAYLPMMAFGGLTSSSSITMNSSATDKFIQTNIGLSSVDSSNLAGFLLKELNTDIFGMYYTRDGRGKVTFENYGTQTWEWLHNGSQIIDFTGTQFDFKLPAIVRGSLTPESGINLTGDLDITSGIIKGSASDFTTYSVGQGNYHHIFNTRTNTGASLERLRIAGGSVGGEVQVSNSVFTVTGPQASDAIIRLEADENDNGSDLWQIVSQHSDNDFVIKSNATEVFRLTDGSGNLNVLGEVSANNFAGNWNGVAIADTFRNNSIRAYRTSAGESVDYNTVFMSNGGVHFSYYSTSNHINAPHSSYWLVQDIMGQSNAHAQLAFDIDTATHNNNSFYFRKYNNTNSWSNWVKVLNDQNFQAGTDYVSINGNEAISGVKTFTSIMNLEAVSDSKLLLKVPAGNSDDWNYISFYGEDGARDGVMGTDSLGQLYLYNDNSGDSISFLNGGGINLNTDIVNVGNSSSALLKLRRSGANYIDATDPAGYIYFRTGGTQNRVQIASSGKLNAFYGASVTGDFDVTLGTNTATFTGDNDAQLRLTSPNDAWSGIGFHGTGNNTGYLYYNSSGAYFQMTRKAQLLEGLEAKVTHADRFVKFKAPNDEERFKFYVGGTGNAPYIDLYDSDGTTLRTRINSTGASIFTSHINASGQAITAAQLVALDNSESARLTHYGVEFDRVSNYLRPISNNDKDLFIGGYAAGSQEWRTVNFRAGDTKFYSPVFIEETLEIGGTSSTGELKFFDTSSTAQAKLYYDEGASEMVYENLEDTNHRFIAMVNMDDDLFVSGKVTAYNGAFENLEVRTNVAQSKIGFFDPSSNLPKANIYYDSASGDLVFDNSDCKITSSLVVQGELEADDLIGSWDGANHSDFVRATGSINQTIGGEKTFSQKPIFSSGIDFGGYSLVKDWNAIKFEGYGSDYLQFDIGSSANAIVSTSKDAIFMSDKVILSTLSISGNLNPAPSSSTDTGTKGDMRFTEDYIYLCTANNTWKRVALSTW